MVDCSMWFSARQINKHNLPAFNSLEAQVSQEKAGGKLGFLSRLTSFGRSSSSKTNEVKNNVDQSVHNKEQNMKNMLIPNTSSNQSVHNEDEPRLIKSHSNKDDNKKHKKVKKHHDENKSHGKSHDVTKIKTVLPLHDMSKQHKKDEDYEKHSEKKHKKSKKHRDDDQDEFKKEHKKKNKKHRKHHNDD